MTIRTNLSSSLIRISASAALAAIVAAAPAPACAFAAWEQDQEIDVDSNTFTQALRYDFESDDIDLTGIEFGDHSIDYNLNFQDNGGDYDFVGVFLFDYGEGAFTADFYAAASNDF